MYFLISNFWMLSILGVVAIVVGFMLWVFFKTSQKDEERKAKAKKTPAEEPSSAFNHLPHY